MAKKTLIITTPLKNRNPFKSRKEWQDPLFRTGLQKNQKKVLELEFLENGSIRTGYFENDTFLGEFIVAPPWHLLDVDYEFNHEMPFEKFSIDLNIKRD